MKTIPAPITVAFFLLLPSLSSAQPDLRWVRFQDGYGKDDFIEDIAVDSGGNVYVAGWTTNASNNSDYYMAKYDPAGNRRWYHLYDNGADDAARSVAVKGAAVYVTGRSRSGSGFGAHDDIVSFVLDTAGTIVPDNSNALRFDFGGSHRDDDAVEIIPAPDPAQPALFFSAVHADTGIAGIFYVAGTHKDTLSGSDDLVVLMYDGSGFLGAASHHLAGDEVIKGMALGGDDAVYIGATSYVGGGSPSYRMVTVKFDRDLAFGWEKIYANVDLDFLLGIAADASGVYVTGTSYSACGDPDVAVIRYAPDGTQGWVTRAYDCASGQVGSGGILVDDNTVYAAGYHANGSQYFGIDKSDGTIRYQGDSPVQSAWVSIVKSYDGNIYFGGHKLFYDLPYDGTHMVKFDGGGTSQWDVVYDGSGSGQANTISKMVSGGSDSSIVLVGSVTVGGQQDMMILKYGVGESMLTGVGDEAGSQAIVPGSYELLQNFPNPFNSSTTIKFRLPAEARVSLKIFDVLGREAVTVLEGRDGPGEREVVLRADDLSSGIYFCRFSSDGHTQTRKLVLMR
ncbi:MAG TPA: T9SS type A sorting domain-containing protein [Bacteroidota bacterium]|nr:T9SS type A sorting domain-containing protein [Bacteroidota bacterium]